MVHMAQAGSWRKWAVPMVLVAALGGAGVALIGATNARTSETSVFAAATDDPPQASGENFKPSVGQPGKDVIWVPTPDRLVTRMLNMAGVTAQDFVVDLGSGDGKIPIAAARQFKARALGIEYEPPMVELSKRNAEQAGVASMVEFRRGDIFKEDFSKATVVTMYLLPELNLRLKPTLLEMKPGVRVVSHSFNMGDWQPDETTNIDGSRGYLWIVPAPVEGDWSFEFGGEKGKLSLKQTYQKISGDATMNRVDAGLVTPTLRGDSLIFGLRDSGGVFHRISAVVSGDTIKGEALSAAGARASFTAKRTSGLKKVQATPNETASWSLSDK
jgi:hypothetical protein